MTPKDTLKSSITKTLVVFPVGEAIGGAEEALLQYATWRQSIGHPLLVAVIEPGPVAAMLRERGAKVLQLDAGKLRDVGRLWRTARRIARWAKAEDVDIILGWMTKAHLYGALSGFLAHKPTAYFQMGLPTGGVVDQISRRLPAVGALGCSEFVAKEQARVTSKYRVLPVPLGVDTQRFDKVKTLSTQEAKRQLGFDPEVPLVGIVGRLQRWKGMHHYINAMAEVLKRHSQVQGVIVGGQWHLEPDYEKELEDLIEQKGLKNKIRMVGAQKDVPCWMQAMDVIIHASEYEPFGIVVIEAMSLGKAVIASIPGGPEEMIRSGEQGLLVQSGDVAALATAIESYLTDTELAEKCGRGARERAQDFSLERYGEHLDQALHTLVS